MKKAKIVWDKLASNQFENAIAYIRKDSLQNALKVRTDILLIIDSLPVFPERHPPDRYKVNNEKNQFRAFEKHRLRVSYFISEDMILIIRVRHTSQYPQLY